MSKPIFRKTPIATGLALALGTSLLGVSAGPAQAQAPSQIEEVIVVGIRASLEAAADIKRYSEGVVDAISAEDIGAFPDTNLAESLQRITGVSIDRARGEGSKVTVRGFGPQYNLVTLNGRQMPTNDGIQRSFDFADLASEMVAGVEVYKTSRAELPTGGIGSTINIKTQRPLGMSEDRTATFGLKTVHDTSAEAVNGDDYTPEISGLFSQKFADGTFGVTLAGSFQERDQSVDEARISGWIPLRGDAECCSWAGQPVSGPDVWPAIPPGANQVNRTTENSELYSIPRELQYRQTRYRRERTNGQLTLQWEPIETVTTTLDVFYSSQELERTYQDVAAWFSLPPDVGGNVRTEWTDGPVAGPLEYTEFPGNPSDVPFAAGIDSTKSENLSVAFNAMWDVTDRLSLEFDYHDSHSENSPDSPLGSDMRFIVTTARRTQSTAYFGADLPIMELGLLDGRPVTPEDYVIGGSVIVNKETEMDIQQAKLAGRFDFTESTTINFGIQTTEVDNALRQADVLRDTWGGVGQAGSIADLLTPTDTGDWFGDFSNGSDSRRFTQYMAFDVYQMIDRGRELAAQGVNVNGSSPVLGDCGDQFCPSTSWGVDRRTQEDQLAAFVQVDFDLEWGDRPVNLNIGLRYEETNVDSQALVPVIERIAWNTSAEIGAITLVDENGAAVQDFTALDGSYDNWLPNIDFNIEVIPDVLFRASYSETMSRPSYSDLRGGVQVANCSVGGGCEATAGDPGLLPLESTNIDLSLEWYYSDTSYVAVGYFKKDVDNFIGTGFTPGQILLPNLTDPTQGGLAGQARAAGANTSDEVRQYIFDNFPNDPSVQVNPAGGGVISSSPANDPVEFLYIGPQNNEDASIDGWEFAWQQTFGETGLGFIVNYTLVNGDVSYNNLVRPEEETQFALFGLSDSANFVGFYDKNGIEVRAAYNWRDQFLTGIGHDQFGAQPRYIEKYGQWDLRASYRWGDDEQYMAFFEGINVTDETFREHARSSLDALTVGQTGARWAIGFRFNLR